MVFLDNPDTIFVATVYSDVDETAKKITGNYRINGFHVNDDQSGITKKEILEIVKEHPENKLW